MKIICPIYRHAGLSPGESALVVSGNSLTYSQVNQSVGRAVAFLEARGIGKNTRVALVTANTVEAIVLLTALWRLGALAVPLNFRFPVASVEEIIKRLGISHLFAPSSFTDQLQGTVDGFGPGEFAAACDAGIDSQVLSGEESCFIESDNFAGVILTSGSTSQEKAVLHTYGNYYYNALGSNENISLQQGDRWLLSLPLFHVGGLGILFRCFLAGCTVVIPGDGEPVLESLERYSITHASLVYTQLVRLLNAIEKGATKGGRRKAEGRNEKREKREKREKGAGGQALFRAELGDRPTKFEGDEIGDRPTKFEGDEIGDRPINPTGHLQPGRSDLKAILLGGSAFPPETIELAVKLNLPVHTTYGLSEAASQVTTTPPGANQTLSTSGKILNYRQIKIDKTGEIQVKGRVLFKGYMEGKIIITPFDTDGWFFTGDLGAVDANGYLTVLGRKDNMFISGGENIMPEEIEGMLKRLPQVEECVVVPKPDEQYGHRPVAFLKLARPNVFEPVFFSGYLRNLLPGFKVPDAFYPWPDDLQQEGLKVKRGVFRKLAGEKEISCTNTKQL
ncbi:MAG: AMP-binding protein [bacterium]|nr:AMP-binding protein [bacterium]